MKRSRIVCQCVSCVGLVGETGCSFSTSGYGKHVEQNRRRAAEEDARDYFANDEEQNQTIENVDDNSDDHVIVDDDIPAEILQEILQGQESTDDEEDEAEENDIEDEADTNHANSQEQHSDPFVPKHPVAFILFLLVIVFYGRFVTDHALEIMMMCFNLVFELLDIPYRLPRRVEKLKVWMDKQGQNAAGIKEHVMCQTCASIYPFESEEEKERLYRHPLCTFKDTLTRSQKCSSKLFERVKIGINHDNNTENNSLPSTTFMYKHIPLKRFYQNSVIHSIKSLMQKNGFSQMLRETFQRNQQSESGVPEFMSDVQHGDIYRNFTLPNEDDVPFTKQSPYNLMLLLNLDWLSLYDRSSFSLGGVWLTILNLDHSERLKRSNTILTSLLPGPREPTQSELAKLLKPLVDELQLLKNGVWMEDSSTGQKVLVRCCLSLVSADLPAIRKAMGISAHNALYSCGFCDHEFDSCENNQRDYSTNLDVDTLKRRTKQSHALNSLKWQQAKTQTERDEIKKSTGTAYTVFQELEYFNCIEFQAVDLLHCSYLGITKRIIRNIWLNIECTVEDNSKLLSNTHLKEMSKLLDGFVFPLDLDGQSLGRKLLIGDGFGYLKASEYAAFLVVSPYLLQGKLPFDKYCNFMKFVEINRILKSPGVYREDIATVKTLTKEFMEEFAELYADPRYISSNFHLFLHLPETMYRYSTPTNTWLFYYERLNSDLKVIDTNNNSNNNVAKTILDRYLRNVNVDELIKKIQRPSDLHEHLWDEVETILTASSDSSNSKTPVKQLEAEYMEAKQLFSVAEYLAKEQGHDDDMGNTAIFVGLEVLPPATVASIKINFSKSPSVMSYGHFSHLIDYYNATYIAGGNEIEKYMAAQHGAELSFEGETIPVSNLIHKFKCAQIFTSQYKSKEGTSSKVKRGSFVLAYYQNNSVPGSPISILRPGQIIYFFRHAAAVRDTVTGELFKNQIHTFAYIRWFKRETRNFTAFKRYNMDVCRNEFEPDDCMSIVPLLRIHSPIAIKLDHFEGLNVFIKMPKSVY